MRRDPAPNHPARNRREMAAAAVRRPLRPLALGQGRRPGLRPTAFGRRPRRAPRGPLARALRVDPTMAAAQWTAGRRRLAVNDPEGARLAFATGIDAGGDWIALHAGIAAALSASGDARAAVQAWESVARQWPDDIRFPLARASAYLDVGEPRIARRLLDNLPRHHARDAGVVALRVTIAEWEGPGDDYESLLAEWADVDRHNPEPIRRRVALHVRTGRMREAYDLLDELTARGAIAEAKTFRMALANDLGRHEDAAREAESLHRFDLARRLRWKARLIAGDRRVPEGPRTSRSREDSLVAAAGALPETPERALEFTDEVLERNPWDPEALVMRATALRLLGRHGRGGGQPPRGSLRRPGAGARRRLRRPAFGRPEHRGGKHGGGLARAILLPVAGLPARDDHARRRRPGGADQASLQYDDRHARQCTDAIADQARTSPVRPVRPPRRAAGRTGE